MRPVLYDAAQSHIRTPITATPSSWACAATASRGWFGGVQHRTRPLTESSRLLHTNPAPWGSSVVTFRGAWPLVSAAGSHSPPC